PDLIGRACKRHGPRRAAVFMGSDLSYAELDRHADAVAAWMQAQGLPAGSHVGLMMPNVMAYLPILVGVLRAGMVLVNINPMYTASELHHQLEDAEVDAIFIFESFAATLAEVDPSVRPGKVVLVSVGDLLGLKGKVLDF